MRKLDFDQVQEIYMPKVKALKPGQKVRAAVPFMDREPRSITIRYVLDSIYGDPDTGEFNKLIVYAVFGKHKQWWHEIMCTQYEMAHYLYDAERERA
jgi:hypothetical protein